MATRNRTESAELNVNSQTQTTTAPPSTAAPPKLGRGAMLSQLHRRLEGKKSTRITVDTEKGEYKYAVGDMLAEHTPAAFKAAASVAGIKATEPAGFIEAVVDGTVVKQEVRESGSFKGSAAEKLSDAIFGVS